MWFIFRGEKDRKRRGEEGKGGRGEEGKRGISLTASRYAF
jgi:hypothetical protein